MLTIVGYFQIVTWLCAYPCADTSSLYSGANTSEQTCDLVSTVFIRDPLLLFQIRMQRSAVPPPEQITLGCQGHLKK